MPIMGTRDTSQRKTALPYIGQVMGYNRSGASDQDVSQTYASLTGLPTLTGIGDLINLSAFVGTGSQPSYTPGMKDFMIRILRPAFAQIISAYLNISLTFDSTEPSPSFSISCGSGYDVNGITPIVPNSTYIAGCMQTITGSSSPFSGPAGQPIAGYKLNIFPLIPQYGEANFSNDSFVVGVHFSQPPVQTGIYHLTKFFVTGSATVIP